MLILNNVIIAYEFVFWSASINIHKIIYIVEKKIILLKGKLKKK